MSQVIALTATFRRAAEVALLIDSLAQSASRPDALILIDNGNEAATREAAHAAPIQVLYHAPGENLGCGGGLRAGEILALEKFAGLTHLWILDDDCLVYPDTLALLLEAMERTGASAAHPLTENAEGRLSWFPGLLDRRKMRAARAAPTPAEFLEQFGAEPLPFSWSQGIALLITRGALEKLGHHRADYWVRGEDLEFSLRITQRRLGIYVPRARVRHLPPAASNDPQVEYPKHVAMLQNLAYTALRLPHGRRIARTLPGNWLRFFRTWGVSVRTLRDSMRAFVRGAIRARPAGKVEKGEIASMREEG